MQSVLMMMFILYVDDDEDDVGGGDDAGGMNSCQDDASCALSSIARKPPHSYHQDYPVHIHHSYCNIIINIDQLELFLIHIYALFQDGLILLIGKFFSRRSTLLTKKIALFHIFLSTIPSLMIPAINFHLCSKTIQSNLPRVN